MFQNREEAGLLLAKKLKDFHSDKKAIILAIPRGGVVVGKQVANILNLPFSVIIVKKLGAPTNPELAIGAVTHKSVKYIEEELSARLNVSKEYLNQEIAEKIKELTKREKILGIQNPESITKNKGTIILIDDGVATGSTILAAVKYIKSQKLNSKPYTLHPKIILAVPVIAKDTYDKLSSEVDRIVALEIPEIFYAVGDFYREFPQVGDEEVVKLLEVSYETNSRSW